VPRLYAHFVLKEEVMSALRKDP